MTNQEKKKLYQKHPNTLSPPVKLQYNSSSDIHLWICAHWPRHLQQQEEKKIHKQNKITNNI